MTIAEATCTKCGKLLHSYAAKKVCPSCLWTTLFSSPSVESSDQDHGTFTETKHAKPFFFDIPNHQIIEEIARGGMGIVYRAKELKPEREVALKMLLPFQGSSDAMRERFRLEIQAAAALEHPNILPVYRTGEHDGLPYFTMKLARGGTLARHIEDFQDRYEAITRLMETIARAIGAAHDRGILHRDLKPGNILLDQDGHVYVGDFGLAKWTQDSEETTPNITKTVGLLGTPNYMPPEVLLGGMKETTIPGDIYALGAILYELLTGRPPHVNQDWAQLLNSVLRNDAKPPRLLNPGVPRDLETICLKCLLREPTRRYASARELADDLKCFLERKPIRARPVPWLESMWMWARRNPILSTMSSVVLVLGLALCIGSFWFWQEKATNQRNRVLMAEMEQAITRDSFDPKAKIEYGLVLERAGSPHEAIDAFSDAIDLASQPPVVWEFSDISESHPWTPLYDLDHPTLDQGNVRFDVTGDDPALVLTMPPVDGEKYRWLHIRMKNGTGGEGGEIFWKTKTNAFFNQSQSMSFQVMPHDEQFRVYSIDLGQIEGWTTNRIVSLRFDPAMVSNDEPLEGRITLKWICLNAGSDFPAEFSRDWITFSNPVQRREALLHRSRIFQNLAETEKGIQDYCLARGIRPRNPNSPSEQIDLTLAYNMGLGESLHDWHGRPGKELEGFPEGTRVLQGIPFDIRGIVLLDGNAMSPVHLTRQSVTNIAVNLPFHRLHALLGTGWDEPVGTEIATIILHYNDGNMEQLPIRYGIHAEDWIAYENDIDKSLAGAEVAWTGHNEFSRDHNGHIRVYLATWPNPRPFTSVQSLDVVTRMTRCSPFLLAVTVE